MNRDKKPLDEEKLEDTKEVELTPEAEIKEIADAPTPEKEEVLEPEAEEVKPGGIESPREEGAKEASEPEKVPEGFEAIVALDYVLIGSKSVQEITTVLDNQLRTIRETAIRKIHRIKS